MATTIRRGLFAALAGFAVLLCLCYTGLAVVISYVTEDMLVQRLLEREAAAITTRVRQLGAAAASGSGVITVYRDYGALPAPVRQQFLSSAPRAEVFTSTGQHYHVMALALENAGKPMRWYLLADVAPLLVVSRLVQEVGGVLIGVALALVGPALLLAWLLARRLVLPLQTLAQEARALAPKHPPRFSARERPDEIGFLAPGWKARLSNCKRPCSANRRCPRRQPRIAHATDLDAQNAGVGIVATAAPGRASSAATGHR